MSDLEGTIRKYALQNAVFFKGKANPKAVAGKVLAERPELRPRSKEITEMSAAAASEVNAMTPEAQRKELESTDPELLVRERKERRYELPALEGAEGGVVMRIAPGPSGPLHIGHSRVSVLNDEYVRRYGGRLINRFEDTNPEKIDPEAYDMIAEDLEWLGVEVHETVIQSDRFPIYYDVTREMIAGGNAYVCTCDADRWREMKEDRKACPCRDLPVQDAMERYDRLLSGGYGEGEAVAVVKTDISHPNPAVRDFVALRVVDHPHPRTGSRYNVYPMMNLSVAVDDHLLGMTHVIRGKDHLNNTFRQDYVYGHMGWGRPRFYHYGLVNIPDTVLKTSLIGSSIRDGSFSGWDDVRTGTLRALRRRGIRPEAIRRYWNEGGMKQIDVQFSWDTLYSMNRDLIDDGANRYFYVEGPSRLTFSGPDTEGAAPKHPDHPERGVRRYSVKDGQDIWVAADDLALLRSAGMIRLKDLCNISSGDPAEYAGTDLSVLKKGIKAVQWVGDPVPTEVLMPDGSVSKGFAESALLEETGDQVQFERFGFVRIEDAGKEGIAAVFSHR